MTISPRLPILPTLPTLLSLRESCGRKCNRVCLSTVFAVCLVIGVITAVAVFTRDTSLGVPLLTKRGLESPSTEQLMWNTIGFGVPAFLAFVARMLNRSWVLKVYHLEDWLMSATILLYGGLLALINVSSYYHTNLYPKVDEIWILADPAEISNRILGSKIVVALEQCMLGVTWGVKICVWIFLLRLHRNSPRFKIALWLQFAYFLTSFLALEVLFYFGSCLPFSQYWAVPVTNSQCATYHNYSIYQMAFNISSASGLILTPLPMVWVAQLPLKKKAILAVIFALASSTIVAAAITLYYNFSSPLTTVYQIWYIREASISILVANAICTWQLLQRIFHLRSFSNTRFEITDNGSIHHNPGVRHKIFRLAHRARHSISGLPGLGTTNIGGYEDPSTTPTHDMELEESRSRWNDRRRDTQFSVERDGDDAGPAILYRSMHNIA